MVDFFKHLKHPPVESAQAAYERLQRRDEDTERPILPPVVDDKEARIAGYEAACLEAYGHFPVPTWMGHLKSRNVRN